MEKITIRAARPADYHSIAEIISAHNKIPASHCIQSSSTDDPSAIAEEIEELYAKDELRFVVAEQEGQLVGLIGCEFDEHVGRGWTRGPFVIHSEWNRLPGELLGALLTSLPPTIRRLDSFLNQEHIQGHRVYLEHGFKPNGLVHVYQAQKDGWEDQSQDPCPEIEPEQEQAFITLHDSVFPVTFINGQGILEQLDQDHKLFVVAKDTALDGYINVSVDKFAGEGYVEFVAVRSELRGKGIGKALLLCALNWCFSVRGLAHVGLTVHEELANAQALYTSVGFQHLYTGLNTRLEW